MPKKNRSGGLVAIVAALTVAGVALFAPSFGPSGPGPVDVTATTTVKVNKPTDVTIRKGENPGNLDRPTRLHIKGLTQAECLDAGGKYFASEDLCRDVDY